VHAIDVGTTAAVVAGVPGTGTGSPERSVRQLPAADQDRAGNLRLLVIGRRIGAESTGIPLRRAALTVAGERLRGRCRAASSTR
jgi:hypothetical protein